MGIHRDKEDHVLDWPNIDRNSRELRETISERIPRELLNQFAVT